MSEERQLCLHASRAPQPLAMKFQEPTIGSEDEEGEDPTCKDVVSGHGGDGLDVVILKVFTKLMIP